MGPGKHLVQAMDEDEQAKEMDSPRFRGSAQVSVSPRTLYNVIFIAELYPETRSSLKIPIHHCRGNAAFAQIVGWNPEITGLVPHPDDGAVPPPRSRLARFVRQPRQCSPSLMK